MVLLKTVQSLFSHFLAKPLTIYNPNLWYEVISLLPQLFLFLCARDMLLLDKIAKDHFTKLILWNRMKEKRCAGFS